MKYNMYTYFRVFKIVPIVFLEIIQIFKSKITREILKNKIKDKGSNERSGSYQYRKREEIEV